MKLFWLTLAILTNNCYTQNWEKVDMSFKGKDSVLYHAKINFVTKNIGWISTTGYYPGESARSILLETQDGKNWELKNEFFGKTYFTATYNLDTNNIWFLGDFDLLFSKDMGLTWDTSSIIHENYYNSGGSFSALHFFNEKKGIALNWYSWFTNDGGFTWSRRKDTTILALARDVFFINERLGWAANYLSPRATDVGSIAKTTDGGKTWRYQREIAPTLNGVAFLDTLNGFAVGTSYFFSIATICKTTDGGENWQTNEIGKTSQLFCIEFLDSLNGWIGGDGSILSTTDGGETWETQIEGLGAWLEQIIILKKEKVAYAFGKNWNDNTHILLRADLSNLTSVKPAQDIKLSDFVLWQNYPNPFNPTTTIKYSLPKESSVELKIYDVMGREIKTFIYNVQSAGINEIVWDGINESGEKVSSGVYIYRIKFKGINAFIIEKSSKMILAK